MLLLREQALDELQIQDEQLDKLIDTNQLTEVRIRGHRRFDSDEVDDLAGRTKWRRP